MVNGNNNLGFSDFRTEVKRLEVKGPEALKEHVKAVQNQWEQAQKDHKEDKLLQIEAGIGDTRFRLELALLLLGVGNAWLADDLIAVTEYLCQPEIQEILIGACGYKGKEAAFLWNCAIFRFYEALRYGEATKIFEEFFKPLHPFFEKLRHRELSQSGQQLSGTDGNANESLKP